MQKFKNYINGEFVESKSGSSFKTIDPSTEKEYAEVSAAEEYLNVEYLGSIKPSQFDQSKINDELILKRARHVITENDRVLKAKEAILNKDIKLFGNLMSISHKSYAEDFEASTKDVDEIVERSLSSGAEGARLTGGGFGGFTVSLIHFNNYHKWKKNMDNFYNSKNIFVV